MKRIVVIVFFIWSVCLSTMAQSGLHIDRILNGKYAADPQVTETFMSGGSNKFLRKHHLTVFATFKGPAAKYASAIEELVLKDAEHATGKNVRYKGGKLYYGMYSFTSKTEKGQPVNRYIYYLNKGVSGGQYVLVMYMEGSLSEEDATQVVRSLY